MSHVTPRKLRVSVSREFSPGRVRRDSYTQQAISSASVFAEKNCGLGTLLSMARIDDEQPLLDEKKLPREVNRDEEEEDEVSLDGQLTCLACVQECAQQAASAMRSWLQPSLGPLGLFLNDTLLYIVSRFWVV